MAALIILVFSSFSNAESKIKFKSKELPQILEQFIKKGYTIVGPVEVTGVTHDYVKFFHQSMIKKSKKIRIINKKGKHIRLHKGDMVYIIKKSKHVFIIKTLQKKAEDE